MHRFLHYPDDVSQKVRPILNSIQHLLEGPTLKSCYCCVESNQVVVCLIYDCQDCRMFIYVYHVYNERMLLYLKGSIKMSSVDD